MSNSGQRILVVDDERVIADTLAIIFRNAGYHTEVAYNGEQALEMARAFDPAVVVSDVLMPGVDGIDAAMMMKRESLAAHILLISGQARSASLLERAHRAGYEFTLLAKPIPPEELLLRVAELLARKTSAASA